MTGIPQHEAVVLWQDEVSENPKSAGTRITYLRVFPIGDQPSTAKLFDNSRGACDADWLKGRWNETPMGLFLELAVTNGFVSKVVKVGALREFAKIEGQEQWTADLLRELGAQPDTEDD